MCLKHRHHSRFNSGHDLGKPMRMAYVFYSLDDVVACLRAPPPIRVGVSYMFFMHLLFDFGLVQLGYKYITKPYNYVYSFI